LKALGGSSADRRRRLLVDRGSITGAQDRNSTWRKFIGL
jgi:hypothetical protein